jgi:hypothetical protein
VTSVGVALDGHGDSYVEEAYRQKRNVYARGSQTGWGELSFVGAAAERGVPFR